MSVSRLLEESPYQVEGFSCLDSKFEISDMSQFYLNRRENAMSIQSGGEACLDPK